jgi:hypothetical protein
MLPREEKREKWHLAEALSGRLLAATTLARCPGGRIPKKLSSRLLFAPSTTFPM